MHFSNNGIMAICFVLNYVMLFFYTIILYYNWFIFVKKVVWYNSKYQIHNHLNALLYIIIIIIILKSLLNSLVIIRVNKTVVLSAV